MYIKGCLDRLTKNAFGWLGGRTRCCTSDIRVNPDNRTDWSGKRQDIEKSTNPRGTRENMAFSAERRTPRVRCHTSLLSWKAYTVALGVAVTRKRGCHLRNT